MESNAEEKAMIQAEIERKGNKRCAECYSQNPNWVSLNLGVFVCQKCAKYHKKLGIDRNNVVSARPHHWTEEQIAFIRSRGNLVVNESFEKYLPKYYHRPDEDDPPIIREQWVKAKYEREEFRDISKQESYNRGSKVDSLFKRLKDSDKFMRRKFHLREPEGVLEYYIKYSDKIPKDSIVIKNLVNVYMVPEKIGNENGMQITYENNGARRNLYLFGENGKATTDWYHAIRASLVEHKYRDFPLEQMYRHLNSKIIREGWMSKTGPKRQEKFRKRWFSLVGTMIWYYVQPLDAHPQGRISLGSKTFGYGVRKGFPQGTKADGYGLTVHTPDRVYALNCTTLEAREKWVESIQKVLDTCTTVWPQPAIGRLVSQHDDETTEENKSEDANESSFVTMSMQYKPRTGSDDSNQDATNAYETLPESVKPTPLPRKPLFEKKKKPHGSTPQKYEKKSSLKRTSTTKKVPDQEKLNELGVEDIYEFAGNNVNTADTSTSVDLCAYEDIVQNDNSSLNDDAAVYDIITTKESESTYPKVEAKNEELTSDDENSVYDQPRQQAAAYNVLAKPACNPKSCPQPTETKSNDDVKDSSVTSNGRYKNLEISCQPGSVLEEDDLTDSSDSESRKPPSFLEDEQENPGWRDRSFSSKRRIGAGQRLSVRKAEYVHQPCLTDSTLSATPKEIKEIKPRPVDFIINNKTSDSFWFMAFQAEDEIDDAESYVTPWIGARVSETPASVGPVRIPDDFEIAVIDTTPGGFGIPRTTGPYYAAHGDVWEVEIAESVGSVPEMFYHEGMETEDGSILVYANIANSQNFEVALYRSGRKLLSRKNVEPGGAVSLKIKPALYLFAVNHDAYFELEGQDLRAIDYIPRASCIELTYQKSRMKIESEKIGDDIRFKRVFNEEKKVMEI